MFMSGIAAQPDDTPPGRFGFVTGLVRRLIAFGQELTAAFQRTDPPPEADRQTICFGADSVAVIVARIARALLRSQVLLERLTRCAARPEPKKRPKAAPRPRAQRAAQPAAGPRGADIVPDPGHLPTAAEIEAEDRRRPIGAVLVDIARDLGIRPSHPLWRDLVNALGMHRGSLVILVNASLERTFASPSWEAAMRAMFPPRSPPAAAATGPP
jgi:hypothetical protein